ncbi:MAG: DNA polymerase III subunit alpha, partial [Muribaculaceae bacterium]|nr:DNA polymerase III subunit alpha [Muribaculaceae bacterium]
RMVICLKGPEVNESWEKFGVNKKGEIRFGLGAVKGVGSNAVNAIISERQANGPFRDIYDFVERVNLSACNRSAIESLALAGSFDSMGYQREAFVEPMGDASFADALVKYGQTIQNDKNSLQMSLFGDVEPLETNKPVFPTVQPWSLMKLLEEEKKLVTIYLSAHPLDPYSIELKYGCNCPCAEFEDKKIAGAKLTMGGMVTEFKVRTSKSGNEYGMLTIEDQTGPATFTLFGRAYETHRNALAVGDTVFLKINVVPGKWDPTKIDVNIDEIHPLDHLKGNVANAVKIFISNRFDTREFFNKLMNFSPQERLGDLFIDLYSPETSQVVHIHSRKKFPVTKDFLNFLDDWGIKYTVFTV